MDTAAWELPEMKDPNLYVTSMFLDNRINPTTFERLGDDSRIRVRGNKVRFESGLEFL